MLVATQGNTARTTQPSQVGHGTTSIKPGALTANQNEPESDNVADVMAVGDRMARGRRKQDGRNRWGTVNTPVILPALREDHSLSVGPTAPPRPRRLETSQRNLCLPSPVPLFS